MQFGDRVTYKRRKSIFIASFKENAFIVPKGYVQIIEVSLQELEEGWPNAL